MTNDIAVNDMCCVALELSKSSWVIAFSPPADGGAELPRTSRAAVSERDYC
jgi:hypothetical protein